MHLFAPYKSCGLSECMQGSQLCQLHGHAPTVTEKIGDHRCMHTREVLRPVRRLRPLEHSKQLRSQYCTRPKAQPMDIPNGACEPPIGTRAIISSESRVPKLPCGLLFYRSSLQRSITRTYQFVGFSSYIGCWLQFLPMRVPPNSQNCLVGFSTSVA